jgi:hypothetical protein
MPQPRSVVLTHALIGKRRCPGCGLPLLMMPSGPMDNDDDHECIFECPCCAYAETVPRKIDDAV